MNPSSHDFLLHLGITNFKNYKIIGKTSCAKFLVLTVLSIGIIDLMLLSLSIPLNPYFKKHKDHILYITSWRDQPPASLAYIRQAYFHLANN